MSFTSSLLVITGALALLALVALARSYRSDRVAIIGGRCVIGLAVFIVLAFIAD